MSDDLKVQVTLTAPVRVSWPQVFEPKAVVVNGVAKGEPFFSARLVFPADHPDIQGLRVTASQLLGKLKPDVDLKTLRPYQDFFYPFKSGAMMIAEAKARVERFNQGKPVEQHKSYRGFEDYMDGCQTLFVKAAAKYPPQIDVFQNGRWIKVNAGNQAMFKDLFYNGMSASATVTLAGVKLPTRGWGVTAYLQALGAIEGGEHLGRQEITHGFTPTVAANSFYDDAISL